MSQQNCSVCNGEAYRRANVLWPALIQQWQLSAEETEYINRQQGECCTACGSNLRSIVLADALRVAFQTPLALAAFLQTPESAAFKILEINEAGSLHGLLKSMPGHVFAAFPDVDMNALPYPDESFDVVVHSDTLEHVPHPVHALGECRRVLRRGGMLAYTIPVVVGRMSRSREGLEPSYHGAPNANPEDYLVQTEFGSDAWTHVLRAGFTNVNMLARHYPAAIAIGAIRTN